MNIGTFRIPPLFPIDTKQRKEKCQEADKFDVGYEVAVRGREHISCCEQPWLLSQNGDTPESISPTGRNDSRLSSVVTPCSKYNRRDVNLLRRQLQVTQGMGKKSRRRNEY